MEKEQLAKEIKSLVCEIIEIPEDQLKGDAKFVDELGVDSLMALEILAALEKKYKVKIPEEKLMELATLNQTVELAWSVVNNKELVTAETTSAQTVA